MDAIFRAFVAPDSSTASVPTDAAAAPAGGGWTMIIMLVVMFALFYFLLIMPQKKKEKQFKSMMEQLKPGDKIVTIGGIMGKVVTVNDQTVEILTGGTKMEITRRAISAILGKNTKDPNEATERQ